MYIITLILSPALRNVVIYCIYTLRVKLMSTLGLYRICDEKLCASDIHTNSTFIQGKNKY